MDRLGEHEVPHPKIGLTLGKWCLTVLCDSQAEVHFSTWCPAAVQSPAVSFPPGMPAVLSMPWLVSPASDVSQSPCFPLGSLQCLVAFPPRSLAMRCHGTVSQHKAASKLLSYLVLAGPPQSGRSVPQWGREEGR